MSADAVQSLESLLDTVDDSPYYILATGPSSRPRRTLKHGDTFAVLDSHGDFGASQGGPDGLFHHDTRYLSRFEFMMNGAHPLLLGSNVLEDNLSLAVDLTNPDIYGDGRIVLPRDSIHAVRSVVLWEGKAFVRLSLRNHWNRPVRLGVSFTFAADFVDLFEVRGARRERHGEKSAEVVAPNEVALVYHGLDDKTRRTSLHFAPQPDSLYSSAASYRLTLPPGGCRSIFVQIGCDLVDDSHLPFISAVLASCREHRGRMVGLASVETSNEVLNEVLDQSLADLAMLITETPQGPYPYAGIPWYSTTFGRDGIVTAIETLWLAPEIVRGVLQRLAFLQATESDGANDAQPGKIIHEMRDGEMAVLGEIPFARYYGSVDSTPLFLVLLGLYVERTGDLETLKKLRPNAEAAIKWIAAYGDSDGDGFTDYGGTTDRGLTNKGWKDSHDAVFHADGHLAPGPIALAEVQGYVYLAKIHYADCLRRLGEPDRARDLELEADDLATRFEAAFWCEDIGTYALALDGNRRRCAVKTSNAGQVLWSGMIAAGRAATVAKGLMASDFFSGWGIRTVAEGASRYNPMSYQNGSVWPHDNALIALGFARYGLSEPVCRVFDAVFDAARWMEFRRLPELYCGFRRRTGRGPTLYPVACSPQAWASGAPFALIQAALGMRLIPELGEIQFRNPTLPDTVDWIKLRNVTIGGASADILVRRVEGSLSVDLVRVSGNARVTIEMMQTNPKTAI